MVTNVKKHVTEGTSVHVFVFQIKQMEKIYLHIILVEWIANIPYSLIINNQPCGALSMTCFALLVSIHQWRPIVGAQTICVAVHINCLFRVWLKTTSLFLSCRLHTKYSAPVFGRDICISDSERILQSGKLTAGGCVTNRVSHF